MIWLLLLIILIAFLYVFVKYFIVSSKTNTKLPVNCNDNMSLQECAKNIVSGYFDKFKACSVPTFTCIRKSDVLLFRNSLLIFEPAYFPLKDDSVTYEKISCVPSTYKIERINITTKDPVEALLYYTSMHYTVFGNYEDSKLEVTPNNKKIECLKTVLDDIQSNITKLLSNNLKNVSWEQYFNNPGPYGSTTGNIKNTWSQDKPKKSKDDNTSLYISHSNRIIKSQFWGNVFPVQDSTASSALGLLIRTQADTNIKRYKNLIETGGVYGTDWYKNILNGENIYIFHKLRKSIRSLGMTIEAYNFLTGAMNMKIPQRLKSKIKQMFDHTVTGDNYKQAFCIDKTNNCVPNQILGFLLILNNKKEFPVTLWGLSPSQYDSLLAMTQFYTLRIGGSTSLGDPQNKYIGQNANFCPASDKTYPDLTNIDKFNDNTQYIWEPPSIDNNKLNGSFCNIDDFEGDLHDIMTWYEQNKNIAPTKITNYIIQSTKEYQEFLQHIDIVKILTNLKHAVCK